jgi:hypothetical protein
LLCVERGSPKNGGTSKDAVLFEKKRTKKLLFIAASIRPKWADQEAPVTDKSFLVLFSKKNCCLCASEHSSLWLPMIAAAPPGTSPALRGQPCSCHPFGKGVRKGIVNTFVLMCLAFRVEPGTSRLQAILLA